MMKNKPLWIQFPHSTDDLVQKFILHFFYLWRHNLFTLGSENCCICGFRFWVSVYSIYSSYCFLSISHGFSLNDSISQVWIMTKLLESLMKHFLGLLILSIQLLLVIYLLSYLCDQGKAINYICLSGGSSRQHLGLSQPIQELTGDKSLHVP